MANDCLDFFNSFKSAQRMRHVGRNAIIQRVLRQSGQECVLCKPRRLAQDRVKAATAVITVIMFSRQMFSMRRN